MSLEVTEESSSNHLSAQQGSLLSGKFQAGNDSSHPMGVFKQLHPWPQDTTSTDGAIRRNTQKSPQDGWGANSTAVASVPMAGGRLTDFQETLLSCSCGASAQRPRSSKKEPRA